MTFGAPRVSYADYLARERASDAKHELVNGELVAMAGGSPEHGRLAAAVIAQLSAALRGGCRVFSSDVRVLVADTGRAAYPDASVVGGDVALAAQDPDAITNPAAPYAERLPSGY